MSEASQRVRATLDAARVGLVDREALVELVALAAVAGEHLLVIGPPGTAKSEAVRRAARAFDARYFEYLLGRFTEPSELFGPIDLRRLREGVVETETSGMLPEAELAFLDEVFLGSTAILNTLLQLLNERSFRRGKTAIEVPLRVCVGASNALPDDAALAAFADRFLLRTFVEPVPDARLEELLEAGDALGRRAATAPRASLADLDAVGGAARAMDLGAVRPALASAIRRLRKAGHALSDRRVVKLQRLVAAAAALDGRDRADARDLWPIVYALPSELAQRAGRSEIRELLDASASGTLGAAALDASGSAAARAARLSREAEACLAEAGDALRAEALLREIDATLENRPPELEALRARLVERLAAA
ncbi:MAG: AAA family ATPase [Sandaracinus sp.]